MDTTESCTSCGHSLTEVNWPKHLQTKKKKCCRSCWAELEREWRKKNPTNILINTARYRAKQKGIPFTIVATDLKIPKLCPVLGIPLQLGSRKAMSTSPSIDRLDPTKGYTPENVRVISWRANKLKSDATYKELVAITNYVKENLWTPTGLTTAQG